MINQRHDLDALKYTSNFLTGKIQRQELEIKDLKLKLKQALMYLYAFESTLGERAEILKFIGGLDK